MRARHVLMLREVFDKWRGEPFDRWPAHTTDLSIMQEHFGFWLVWMQRVRLARAWRRMGPVPSTNLFAMLGCDVLGL